MQFGHRWTKLANNAPERAVGRSQCDRRSRSGQWASVRRSAIQRTLIALPPSGWRENRLRPKWPASNGPAREIHRTNIAFP